MNRILLALVVFISLSGLALAQAGAPIQERMSAEQFKAAGLDKLSAEELASLNAWMQSHDEKIEAAVKTAVKSENAQKNGFLQRDERNEIVSRIAGKFDGWQGGTQFVLENGQTWVQAETGSLSGVHLQNPTVTIRPGFMSNWTLKVEGYNSTVKVRRIK